jgi:AraC-like DNA-binding protein
MLQSVGRFTFPADRLILPDVCCDVSVVDGRAFFTGAMTRARSASHVGREVLLLRIGIASVRDWLRMPVAELTDLVVPLDEVDRRLAFDVERYLANTESTAGIPPPIERPVDVRFVAAARALGEGVTVRTAAARVALTERQLERVFRDRAGVTPKQFARIVRFRKALFAARAGAPLVIAAAESGYADQAHFTRETQALTGYAPRALLPRTGNVASVQDSRKWRDVSPMSS